MKALDGYGYIRPPPLCTTVCRYYEWSRIKKCWRPTPSSRWFIHRHDAVYWLSTQLPNRPYFGRMDRWFIHEQDLRGHCRIYPIPLED